MGSCNFSIQDSLTVGRTNPTYTDEEIAQYAQENEIDAETAQEWMAEKDFADIADAELLEEWERINK